MHQGFPIQRMSPAVPPTEKMRTSSFGLRPKLLVRVFSAGGTAGDAR